MITGSLRRRAVAAGALVLTGALALSACGEKEDDTPGAGAKITPAGGADARLAGMVPADVKADGKIVIGVDAAYAPNEFLDTDGKTVVGWDRELFDAVAAKLGLKTEWVSSKFDDILPGVQSGKYEGGVSSFTINDERKKQVLMVSYFNAGSQWATKKGNPVGVQPDNACGKKVAVQKATVHVEDLEKRSKACTDAGKPAISINQYQAQDQATAALVSGKEDASVADSPIIAYAVKQTNGQLDLLGDIYDAAPYGFLFKKEQTQLAQAVQEATKALMTDGTYKKILEKWNVQAGAVNDSAVNP
ncbi:ABC transporter substrate-binding protein [Actinomadura viridis]|uniref:Polar amino acid transport system substrate-binding protein n=1 Tax=Actinomadura viridis TaxID=58110 RepID=A0A931DFS7_9ACTN|nr:ABC transporter substrate-binding protein [Actinomadura viridis]MBG6087492.1 polar amino acid transport system substrate-binding protein [Actinomadura viridis]